MRFYIGQRVTCVNWNSGIGKYPPNVDQLVGRSGHVVQVKPTKWWLDVTKTNDPAGIVVELDEPLEGFHEWDDTVLDYNPDKTYILFYKSEIKIDYDQKKCEV